MAERSFILDFNRVDDFFENFNISFFISEMWEVTSVDDEGNYSYGRTGSNCYEFIAISDGGDSIDEYLNDDGTLDTSAVNIIDTVSCALDWYNRGDGEATIELHDSVSIPLEEVTDLKALLIRDASTGYVMGYSINSSSFSVSNAIVFDDDVVLWDIRRIVNGG